MVQRILEADHFNAKTLFAFALTVTASLVLFELVLEGLGFDTRRLHQEADKRWRGEVTVTKKTGNC